MKICVVIDHLKNGGAERVVQILTDALIKNGHRVSIVVTIDQVNYQLNPLIDYRVAEQSSNNIILRRFSRQRSIHKIFEEIDPDIILAFGYYMNLYSIFANQGLNKRLIISERNDPVREIDNKFLRIIRNRLYNLADTMVCQTEMAADYYRPKLKEKIVIIPNPIKADLPKQWNGKRTKRIVTACRLEKQKNLPLLINAFAEVHKKHPDYTLTIYGDGSQKAELEQLIAERQMQDSVHLPGFSKNIHQDILDASMYVSSSNFEGISNSMLEAMGIGLPIICTDCPAGGAALAIQDGINGQLVPVRDKEALANAMNRYIERPAFADECSKNAMQVRERFSADKIAAMWMNLWE